MSKRTLIVVTIFLTCAALVAFATFHSFRTANDDPLRSCALSLHDALATTPKSDLWNRLSSGTNEWSQVSAFDLDAISLQLQSASHTDCSGIFDEKTGRLSQSTDYVLFSRSVAKSFEFRIQRKLDAAPK